jgi:polyhydroxyalkanoate synthesis regulator phasin
MADSEDSGGTGSGDESARGIPDGLREAIEGAFAATGKTRDRAQDLTERTRAQAQELVEEVSKRRNEARGTLEGMRLVNRDDLRELEAAIDELSSRVAKLEAESKPQVDG